MYFYFLFLILISNTFGHYTCILHNTDNNLLQCIKINPYNYFQNHLNQEISNQNIEYFHRIINNPIKYDSFYNTNNNNYNIDNNNYMGDYNDEY